jgi:hypothetical protein
MLRFWFDTGLPIPALGRGAHTKNFQRDVSLRNLDAGEEDAIALAIELDADLVLMDDREGVLAAQRGLLILSEAFDRIKRTNFRYRQATMDALLAGCPAKRKTVVRSFAALSLPASFCVRCRLPLAEEYTRFDITLEVTSHDQYA